MNILLIGSGGREHAMAWKIKQSSRCSHLYVAPGNYGTSLCGTNVELDVNDFESAGELVKRYAIDMVVVGPEEPLVKGLADYFASKPSLKEVLFVGPVADGARLEGSKAFAKAFMQRHGIPTAAYRSYTTKTMEKGKAWLQKHPAPYVLKADGLAAGKGVIICQSLDEATSTLEEMLTGKLFGQASETVVIEEFLHGIEVSVFVITDGRNYKILPEAKDYKRAGEDDTGPNTGGMGAVSPVPFADRAFMKKVEDRIIKPTISGLEADRIPYCGFIFFGLMVVKGEPYVIEYNTRLGDPEAQAILPRLESDFVELLQCAASGQLDRCQVAISKKIAATVVLTSGGYPGSYEKGFPISHLERVANSLVFYAGVRELHGIPATDGGRIIAVTSLEDKLQSALNKSYENARIIDFKGLYYRRDIGKDLLR